MSRRLELSITIAGDAFLLCTAFFIAWKASEMNQSFVSVHAIVATVLVLIYWLFLFQTADLYLTRSKIQLMNEMYKMFQVIVIGLIFFIAATLIARIDFIRARGFIPSYAIVLSSLLIWRFFWRGLVGEYVKPKQGKVVIFHNGDAARDHGHFNVVERISLSKYHHSIPTHLLKNNDIDGILIESNGVHQAEILKVISTFADTKYEIYISPKLYPFVYNYSLVEKVDNSKFLKVVFHPLSTWDRFLKRVIDIVISVVSLTVLSPILFLLGILIRVDTPGPVFHKQERVGLRGKRFTLVKFRSMISDAEKNTGPIWAEKNDKRITRIGRIIRPFRLDELPQIVNVLRGEMSFVGPRPERPAFVDHLTKAIPFYGLRLTVHPGITGWAQVKHNYDQSVSDVKKKLEFDLEYINNMSIRLDLKIFLKTVLTVMKKEGAH
ncbi:MAG: sugar transferase [candidate division WOR-3 bacterium]|jgi:exopolysaccharide biosynthesis polyprenyl glycosylphosphotransferase